MGHDSAGEVSRPTFRSTSEHRVAVRRLGGYDLQHVPMLDDPASVVEAEDVDTGPVRIPVSRPVLMAMQHDQVAFGDDALEVHALARVCFGHPFEIVDEGLLAVRNVRI